MPRRPDPLKDLLDLQDRICQALERLELFGGLDPLRDDRYIQISSNGKYPIKNSAMLTAGL